jgi:hypothetical protein
VAGGNEKRADRLYQTGYYYNAKHKGMLDKVGWDALASVKPKLKDGPTVAAAEAEDRAAEMPATTASIEPVSSRFGEAPARRSASVVATSAPTTAMGYAGSVPTAVEALPGVMTAPPERPGS